MTTSDLRPEQLKTKSLILDELRTIHAQLETVPNSIDQATAAELSDRLSVLRGFVGDVDRLPQGVVVPVLDAAGRLRSDSVTLRDDLGALVLGVQDWYELSLQAGNGGTMFEAGQLFSAIGLALADPALVKKGLDMRDHARGVREMQDQAATAAEEAVEESSVQINPEVAAIDDTIAQALARTPLELTEAEVSRVQNVLEELLATGDTVTVQAVGSIVMNYLESRPDFGEETMSITSANSYVSGRRLLAYTLEYSGASEAALNANIELVREVVLNWDPRLLGRMSSLHRAFCLRFSAAEDAVGELGITERIDNAIAAAVAYTQGGRLDQASGCLVLAGNFTRQSGNNPGWFELINEALKKAYESESFPSIATATVEMSRVYSSAERFQQAAQILIDLMDRAKALTLRSTAEQESLASVMVELAGLYGLAQKPSEQARLMSQAHSIYLTTGNQSMAMKVAARRV